MSGLLQAQAAAGVVEHDAQTESGPRYSYASTETIIQEARRALLEGGVTLAPMAAELVEVAGHLILRSTWTVGEPHGPLTVDWPVCPGKGRPLDKAVAAARTASLGYLLRDLLLLPRVERGTDLNDEPSQGGRGRGETAGRGSTASSHPDRSSHGGRSSGHHPSWEGHRKVFCAGLANHGLRYDDVARWAESKGYGRPSGWESWQRGELLVDLKRDAAELADLLELAKPEPEPEPAEEDLPPVPF